MDDTVTIQSKTLPFDINLKSIPAFNKLEHGFNFSSAGLRINLRRNSLGLLFGSFYGPTAIFAMLSMLSYCIKTDVVCKSIIGKNLINLISKDIIFWDNKSYNLRPNFNNAHTVKRPSVIWPF